MKASYALVKLTLGKKFGVLLAIFLALQILQLGAGIHQVRHVSDEGGHLGAVGSLRPASLADLARRLRVAGSDRPALRQQLLDGIAAQDRVYGRLDAAFGHRLPKPAYAEIARSAAEARDAWEKELRPLIRSLVETTESAAARAALARYEALFPVQAGRLARLAALVEQHLREEIRVSLRTHAAIFALSMLLALVAAWIVRRQVAAPLGELARASQAIARGAYDRPLPVALHDEIGQLARAMREMAATLHMRDVEFAHAFDALHDSSEVLERIFENTQFHIACLDREFNFLRVNRAYAEIGGHPPAFFVGKNHFALYPGAEVEAIFRKAVETGEPHTVYARPFVFPDQPERGVTWWDWTVSPVRDTGRRVVGLVFALVHVTERVKAEQRANFLHLHDELTDLPNRALLLDRLQRVLVEAARRGREAAVLCVDLDRFKYVNETLGHAAGDVLLKEAAARLSACVRPGDTVARLAGDEFALVLADMASVDDVGIIVQKIMGCGAKPFVYEGHEHFMSVSLGIALYPLDGADATELLKYAELAMHQAKERGGNGWQFYSAQMADKTAEKVALSNELRQALEQGQFLLYYQPQVDIASGRIVGAEALARWQHPQRGLVSPATFIPLAEETGLIVPLGEWVLRQACDQARAWRAAGLPALRVAVNISALQFRQNNLAHTIEQALTDCGLPPDVLEIEVTESLLMPGDEQPQILLRRIADLGVRIAIDDFGTGYSGLSYLKRFPIGSVKVDQSFVRDLATDNDDASIVNAIVAMAQSLEIETVAEGVETGAQFALLQAYGCDLAQGFYFSVPLPAEEFARLLREQHDYCRGKDYVS